MNDGDSPRVVVEDSRLLASAEPAVRRAAAFRLASAGVDSAELCAVLIEAARDPSSRLEQSLAIGSLGRRVRRPEVREFLVELLACGWNDGLGPEAAEGLAPIVPSDKQAAEAMLLALVNLELLPHTAEDALSQPGIETARLVPELLNRFRATALPEDVRGRVGVVLARRGHVDLLPELLAILTAPESDFEAPGVDDLLGLPLGAPALKVHALRAIQALGPAASGAAEAVLPFLEVERLRTTASLSLLRIGATGDAVENALTRLVAGADAWLPYVHVEALAATGVRLDSSLTALLQALEVPPLTSGPPVPDVPTAARDGLKALAKRAGAGLVERIRVLSRSPDAKTRSGALAGLLILGVPTTEVLSHLVCRLADPSADRRQAAAGALRLFGARAAGASEAIRDLLTNAQPATRAAALGVSASVGGAEPWVVAALEAGLQDVDAQVRQAACGALCDLPSLTPELLGLAVRLQSDRDTSVRAAAVAAQRAHTPVDRVSVETGDGSDVEVVTRLCGRFLFRLCRALPEDGHNRVLSSFSVFSLLGVLLRATGGESRRELMDALGWNREPAPLLGALGALASRVSSGGAEAFKVVSASGLWTQQGYPVRDEFLREVSAELGLSAASVDFESAPALARREIDQWVSEKTAGQIGSLASNLSASTRFVLANVIAFKSQWARPFSEHTRLAPFRRLDGSEVEVPMMVKQGGFFHLASDRLDFELIELRYQSNQASMLVVLPRPGFFSRVERSLDHDTLERSLDLLEDRDGAELKLPKFALTATLPLRDLAAHLGAPSVLTSAADLSGLTTRSEPWQGSLMQLATIAVDERGTEAAAATSFTVSMGDPPPEVVVDRPFLFFIRHRATGVILFNGRLVDPAGERVAATPSGD